jgi:hypothetical protein
MLEYILQFLASAITEGSSWEKERIPKPDGKKATNKNLKNIKTGRGFMLGRQEVCNEN